MWENSCLNSLSKKECVLINSLCKILQMECACDREDLEVHATNTYCELCKYILKNNFRNVKRILETFSSSTMYL